MRILVVGGGGREHAIIQSLKRGGAAQLFAAPGNGGIAADATCAPIGATEIDKIVAFATEQRIDLAVVAPDDPLVLGAVDALEAAGIACFGPNKAAAAIEGSKVFAKGLMQRHGIPTADYAVFSDLDAALRHLDAAPLPTVIKADGLALGKGVVIAHTRQQAAGAVCAMMRDKVFGESGSRVVVEEFLTGPEVSVLAFTDGVTMIPMVSAMDHKRAWDGDQGPNTGGMGAIAPNPYYTPTVAARCMEEIFLPTMRAMNEEGRPFKGCLFFGLMLTAAGPKVIEYNCRFGDPETQAVLPLLETDLTDIFLAVAQGRLGELAVRFRGGASCCVVLASRGYPGAYETGFPISIPDDMDAAVCIAGAKRKVEILYTSGGRVLSVTATADTLRCAVDKAYAQAARIHFDNAYYRTDIGAAALNGLEGV